MSITTSNAHHQHEFVKLFESAIRGPTMEYLKRHPDVKQEDLLSILKTALQNVMGNTIQDEVKLENSQTTKKKPIRVYLDGCFDIMHSGHYNAIRQAKALGDILVAGVHSDEEILKNKGPPVMNDQERLAIVKACKWVDEVVFDTPYDPNLALLDKLNCDFCVHGDDIPTNVDGKGAYEEVKRAGRMKVIKRTEGISTTDLVGRLLLMTRDHHLTPNLGPSVAPIVSSNTSLAFSLSHSIASNTTHPSEHALLNVSTNSSSSVLEDTSKTKESVEKKNSQKNKKEEQGKHYSEGVSSFLATTWRISQFANNRIPTKEDKIVYIDGSFDLFHIGHVETLQKAKALGTFLYVGIHDDATVNKHKGRNYPVMNLHERILNVLSCRYCDEVVIGAPWDVTKDLIVTLNIQVVVSGTNTKMDFDFEPNPVDPYLVPKQMGMFVAVDTSRQLVTADVVNRIIENRKKYEQRNDKRSKKELAYIEKRQYIAEI